MWSKVSSIYLIVCACVLSLLSMPPAGHEGWEQLVILTASLSYPLVLVWMRPKTGFWKSALQLLLIIVVALLCSFVTYLLWYAYYQYKRLGSEFHLLEALGWTFDESLAWFVALDVIPVAIIAGVCYPIGYMASRLLIRRLLKVEDN
ncbi:MAG: hypothetical protein ACLPXT_08875 [Terracidiphilus sp.]